MAKTVLNVPEFNRMRTALAYGMLNLGFYVQSEYQQRVHVITGNLRRSAHTVAYMDGKVLEHTPGVETPPYPLEGEMGVIVGTNTGYGLFEEVGTSKRPGHPALGPAAQSGSANAESLVNEGAKAHYK